MFLLVSVIKSSDSYFYIAMIILNMGIKIGLCQMAAKCSAYFANPEFHHNQDQLKTLFSKLQFVPVIRTYSSNFDDLLTGSARKKT